MGTNRHAKDRRGRGRVAAARELVVDGRDRHDRRLLQYLALARDAGDALRARLLAGELLDAYRPFVRRRAAARLRRSGARAEDLEDVVAAAIERLLMALARQRDHEALIPFTAVVVLHTDWAVADLRRARVHDVDVELLAPAEMPDGPGLEEPALVEQTAAIEVLLDGLSVRQRVIVLERALVELPFGEIAARHGLRTKATEKIATRALAQLRVEAIERLARKPLLPAFAEGSVT
jgi:RNA polymerase sigma factor (sigma-70 family)